MEQVQEVCDRVGIIFRGKMVREGTLAELTRLDDQTEITLRDAPAPMLEAMKLLAAKYGSEWMACGQPRTTLERLFLEATGYNSSETQEYVRK